MSSDRRAGIGEPGPIADSPLWDTLVSEPEVGVAIVSAEGRLIFVNEQSSRMFLDRSAGEAVGRLLSDLFPEEWVAERLELMRRIRETGKPMFLRSIWRGKQIQSTMRLIDCHDEHQEDRFLVITRFGTSEVTPDAVVVESRVAELGDLDVLTPKELEVLALLGQGQRLKDIAKMLHRSPKTIDNHRTSIGRKLQEADRVKLAAMAGEAGLELSDAELKRVRLDQ